MYGCEENKNVIFKQNIKTLYFKLVVSMNLCKNCKAYFLKRTYLQIFCTLKVYITIYFKSQ